MGSLVQLGNHAQFRNGATFGSIPILNQLSVSSAAAYSLRLLNSNYTGNCIRVRRSSDNTELNIGFVNGLLDFAKLLTFVGSGSGFITTWYDQSGNGRNAIQTVLSNQPRIVNSGALDVVNNKSTVTFSPSDTVTSLIININDVAAKEWTINTVIKSQRSIYTPEDGGLSMISDSETTRVGVSQFDVNSKGPIMSTMAGTLTGNINPSVITGRWSSSAVIRNNGTQYGTGSFSPVAIPTKHYIGSRFSETLLWFSGGISEYFLFGTALNNNDISLLERNQGQFYGITVI